MKITASARPFILSFDSGNSYKLTSEEAQRLLDATTCPKKIATSYRIVLLGQNGDDITLQPATIGGGPAFLIED